MNRRKVCLICSSGGHLEQIKQLKMIIDRYDCFYVTNMTKFTKDLNKRTYFVNDLYRGRIKVKKFLVILFMFLQQFIIFIKERPDVVITTGAGIAIPMCLIAKFFGKKTVYIESFARINSTNKTGEFLYKHVDLFVVQWKQLLEFYPDAIYGGWIY